MIQVGNGLSRAHAVGVIHRDIKPENIRLTKAGIAKILDFGLARVGDSSLTMNRAMGTPAYMAPEQWGIGGGPTHQSDIWACGVILYEMLAHRRPFEGDPRFSGWDRAMSIMQQVVHDPPPPLEQFNPRVPDDLELIVGRALEKSPPARYGSMEEFVRDLIAAERRLPERKNLLEEELRREALELRRAVEATRGAVNEALARDLLDATSPVDEKLQGLLAGSGAREATVSKAPRSYSGLVFELDLIAQQRRRLDFLIEEAGKPPSFRRKALGAEAREPVGEPGSPRSEPETIKLADLEERRSLLAELEEAAALEKENRVEEANHLASTILERCEGRPALGEVRIAAKALAMRTQVGGVAARTVVRSAVGPRPPAAGVDKPRAPAGGEESGKFHGVSSASPKRRALVWGFAAFLALVVLGGYFLSDEGRPPAPATPGRVWLGVSPWAEILWVRNADSQEAVDIPETYAPCWLSLPAGRYEIGLANQFSPETPLTLSVTVEAEQTSMILEALPGFDDETIPIDF
jgi:hypothetical protein